MKIRTAVVTGVLLAGLAGGLPPAVAQDLRFDLFARYLEALRQQTGVPGMAVVIVSEGQIVWEAGFGHRDIERSLPVSPSTPFVIGDLTQTFAAVLTLHCVERGRLDLDDAIRRWTTAVPEDGATVAHVLAHTSEGAPGALFKYDPGRYTGLTPVIEACWDEPYRRTLEDEILDRLAMRDSVPGLDLTTADAPARALFDDDELARYALVLDRVATPYRLDHRNRPVVSEYPERGLNAATGLVSTVRDLARYDAALNDGVLLREETRRLAWTPRQGGNGLPLPTGLGWFVQSYNGERVVWHFGLVPNASSSLVVKVPGRELTMILLANSDGLSAPFRLPAGDVTASPFARVFLRFFLP